MKWRWLTVFYTCFLVSGFACARLHADATHYDSFLEQLKSRGWYDTALLYLEEIEQDPNLPETIRTRLPFDQAQISKLFSPGTLIIHSWQMPVFNSESF